ncbi:MAG TPA: SpoIIE family protein phosphatase [Candidatus Kapabacteria bacterium]|nr:SpoIIE family protein phosphatase [Candidatus Kapabacteria bacterium]
MHDRPLISAAATHDLGTLLEFSRILNECDSREVIFSNVLLSLMGKLGLGRAGVAVPVGDGTFIVEHVKGGAADLMGLQVSWNPARCHGIYPVEDAFVLREERECAAAARVAQVMPVTSGESMYALLLLGSPLVRTISEGEALSYTLLIGAIAAMALEGCETRSSLYEANRRLERRIHRLRSLFEAVREFSALLDQGAILRLLGFTLMGEMAISRFCVALSAGGTYREVVNHRFSAAFPPEVLAIVAGWGMRVFNERRGLNDQEATLFDLGVRATVPMEAQGNLRGLLLVGERLQYDFDEEDVEYLASLANLAIGALENARLLEEMIVKERMEEDLRIAADIQQALLPRALPAIAGYELAAQTTPTQQVGGDCYDAIELHDGRVLITIADVSGKGTPASLLMASVQAAVRALAQLSLPLDDFVARVNDVIYNNTAPDKFITAFFGVIDPASHLFTYVNAGHNPPFLFSADGMAKLECGGVILGIMPSLIPYMVGTIALQPEDLLLLYTDGVNEAFDTHQQEYGEARMQALFANNRTGSAMEALERLRADVRRFIGTAPQSDDITIVTLRRI